jgi:CelD/BcsL family acetyltransferase involved in cellulose biosynthesis
MRPCLERIPRKLRREHETRFERVAAPAQLPGALEHLFRLHSLRWEAAGERGIFATQAIRALHREVALRLLELGWLELWLLRIDGEVAAAQYNFRLADVVYFYASGYVPGRYDRYAAGRTLMAHTIRTAIEEGVRAYDFLRGDHAYKRRFGAEAVPQVALEGYAGPLARAGLGAWDAAVAAARTVYRTARRRAAPHVRRRAVAGPPGARAATSS